MFLSCGCKVSARRAEWQEKLVFIDIPEPQPNLREASVSARRAEWQEKQVLIGISQFGQHFVADVGCG